MSDLTELKAKADRLGIKYSGNISATVLQERINQAESGEAVSASPTPAVNPVTQMRNEALKLVRVVITPMDKLKKDYEGEVFSASNARVSVKRYVPFNVVTHVENIILEQLKDKKAQIFVRRKTSDGNEVVEGKLIAAYGVVEQPALTQEQLADLAKAQQARNSIE